MPPSPFLLFGIRRPGSGLSNRGFFSAIVDRFQRIPAMGSITIAFSESWLSAIVDGSSDQRGASHAK
jgi:hypothetical protein